MKSMVFLGLLICLAGCASQNEGSTELIETQEPLVTGCSMLGVISETADAGWISEHAARYRMIGKVKARAAQLGTTHIVWLHKTDYSAAAKAYRCK
ncbi:MAG: hypothetical protein C4519_01355 [Desulfobacteraceae bacterium]|nr:MAG: hypothetical protein C4519_01355 [Desulfobacteraceae bacterium]